MIAKVINKISNTLSMIATWLVLVLVLIICIDVFARYLFNKPTEWIYEMSYILGSFIAAFGFSQLIIDDGNIRVDLFYVNFSRKIQLIIDTAFTSIIFIPTYFMVLIASGKNLLYAFQTKEVSVVTTWYPPLWPIKLMIFIGLIMLVVQLILITVKNIIELIKTLKGGDINVG